MHFFFLTRGNYRAVQDFKGFMNAQMWLWTRKNLKTNKDEQFAVQGGLRPVQLWEYVIPQEHMDELLTSLDIGDGKVHPKNAQMACSFLRKALGAKKIPKYKTDKMRLIPRHGVGLYPIGIKHDKVEKWDEMGYEQEML